MRGDGAEGTLHRKFQRSGNDRNESRTILLIQLSPPQIRFCNTPDSRRDRRGSEGRWVCAIGLARRSKADPRYSIASSARAKSDFGIVSPNPFAVLVLMTNRYVVA